jgi:hypothetical protein
MSVKSKLGFGLLGSRFEDPDAFAGRSLMINAFFSEGVMSLSGVDGAAFLGMLCQESKR